MNPESGKGLQSIKLKYADGSAVPVVSGGTFKMPKCDVKVEAKFAGGYYMGVISNHGSVGLYVNDVATTTASKGASVRISVNPHTGYTIKRIYVQKNGGDYGVLYDNLSNNSSFTMPDCRVFVRVEYEGRNTYSLSKQGDLYGSFKLLVNDGEVSKAAAGATVDILPYNVTDGYVIKNVTVVSSSDSNKEYYNGNNTSFTMPADAVTVKVSFAPGKPDAYDIDIQSSSNGEVTANYSEAKKGTNVTLQVKPAAGYELEYVKIKSDNGEAVYRAGDIYDGNKLDFTMPASNVKITASFKPVSVTFNGIISDDSIGTVTVSANGNALAQGSTDARVGDSIKVNVEVKKAGYAVDTIYLRCQGGNDGTVNNSFTLPACTSFSIEVTYKAQDNKLAVQSNWVSNYTVSINGGAPQSIDTNDTVELNVPTGGAVTFNVKDQPGKYIELETSLSVTYSDDGNSASITVPAGGASVKVHLKDRSDPNSLETVASGSEELASLGTSPDGGESLPALS